MGDGAPQTKNRAACDVLLFHKDASMRQIVQELHRSAAQPHVSHQFIKLVCSRCPRVL